MLNCFTQSDYAPFSDADSLHSNDRVSFVSALRKREDTAWSKLLQPRPEIVDLDLLDAPLRLSCPVHEVFAAEIRPGDRALARVAGAIAKLARMGDPGKLAFVLPLAMGGHIDHRVTRQAGLEALANVTFSVAFYEDLPYAAREGAEGEIAETTASTALPLRPLVIGEATADAAEAMAEKRRMAECYDSQINSEEAAQIAQFAAHYGGRERVWCNDAWWSSPLYTELPAPHEPSA